MPRRGLTLVELMLALAITVLVAGALSSMVNAVVIGANDQDDQRSSLVAGSAVSARLAGYVVPARCVLDADSTSLCLWQNDDRQSGTPHATELRWFTFDADAGELLVEMVDFPDGWTQVQRDLADLELPWGSDYWAALTAYRARGHITALPIADLLDSFEVRSIAVDPRTIEHVVLELGFATSRGPVLIRPSATIADLEPPA